VPPRLSARYGGGVVDAEKSAARRARAFALAGVLAGAILGACGSTTSGVEGISCTSDSDCNQGLACLPYMAFEDGGCTPIANECLQRCQADSDCEPMGVGLICFSSCGSQSVCEASNVLEGGVSTVEGGDVSAEAGGGGDAVAE
jgi:hypothetical protein